jgi:hypothetical protein
MTQGRLSESPATPEAIAAIRAHPRFRDAIRVSASGMVAKYEGTRLLNWLMDDRARLVFSYLALYLHFSHDPGDSSSGLTPTRMKVLCVAYGTCSPGRAAAMLSLMRFAGYLAPDPAVRDRRQRRLIATDKLIGLLRDRWRIHYTAMAPLLPDGEAMLAALDDPAYIRALVLAIYARYRADFRFMTLAPTLGLFAERNGGMFILFSLLAASEADDSMPPRRPLPLSISALSRRFAVSRPHVLTLIRDAAADGLIERIGPDGDRLVLSPQLADGIQTFFAVSYLFFADCAREALAAIGRDHRAA